MATHTHQPPDLAKAIANIAWIFSPEGQAAARARAAAFIGPRLENHVGASAIVRANINARFEASWQAGRAMREAQTKASREREAALCADLNRMANGTPYERACYDAFILECKDVWSVDDYAEMDRINARKRAAANNLEVAA